MLPNALGKAVLDAAGWTIEGAAPDAKKFVLIAAPHTSNWDFVYALSCTTAMGLPLRWMGKDALFRGPQGLFFRALGGIPVDRSKNNNMVQCMADELIRADVLALLVPAEGTRKAGKYWKSGFYHIARKAGVPVALGYLDYARKCAGIGPLIWPTDDVKADMDRVRAFYADVVGKHPAAFTPPRLREEDAAPNGAAPLADAVPVGARK
jgi:1-acyl-sn-glycerol-3-phosphate acyltransferase